MKRLLPCLTAVVAAAGCEPTLVVEATPSLATPPLSPGLICQEQHDAPGTPLLLSGDGFAATPFGLPDAARLALPRLTLSGTRAVDGSAVVDGPAVVYDGIRGGENADLLRWTSSSSMTLLVPETLGVGDGVVSAFPTGLYDLTLDNPDGQTVTAERALAVVERPRLQGVAPPLLCLAQGEREVVVSASGALTVGDALPLLTIGDQTPTPTMGGCVAIDQPGTTAAVCDTLTVTLPQEALDVGEHALSLVNPAPADCASLNDGVAMLVVAPPVLTSIAPATLCADAGVTTLTVSGADLLVINDVPFAVTINGAAATPTVLPDTCTLLPVPGAGSPVVQRCTGFTIDVDTAALPVGGVEVAVQNPAPAGCGDVSRALLRIDPVPALASVEPAGTCEDSGDITLTVAGSGFAILDGAVFAVTVGGVAATPTPSGCVDVDAPGVTLQQCSGFSVTVAASSFPLGGVPIAVTNPGPSQCSDVDATLFSVSPTPVVERVNPSSLCVDSVGATVDVTVTGGGFVIDGGDAFLVRVGGTLTPVTPLGCVDVALPAGTVQSCSGFVVTVDVEGRPIGSVPIAIENPPLPGCLGTAATSFDILPPPTLTGVLAAEDLCSDVLTSIVLSGTGLGAGTTVDVGGRVADLVVPNADGTEATATFSDGLPAGNVTVTVNNGDCEAGASFPLSVDPSPIVFFVNPPVLFDDISIDATIFSSALAAQPLAVELVAADGTRTALSFADGGRPGRILATIPAGLPVGDYAVRVTNELACESAFDGQLTITDRLTLPIDTLEPAFVSSTIPTGITLRTTNPLPAGSEGFAPVPQVYLNPTAGGGQAIALRAVEVIDAGALTAVVAGAAPGVYDVVVVNPTGAVGLLPGGLTVTVAEPPRVFSVAPASLDAGATAGITILGEDFDTAGVDVTLDCRNFLTGAPVAPGTVSVTTTTATSIDAVVNAAGVQAGSICVVVVENGDGASFRFSALSFKEPSQNLGTWRVADGSALNEGRRGLALVAGRPTDTSRFLYAIGGDGGDVTSAKTSVEAASVADTGTLGAFTLQRHSLDNAFVGGAIVSRPKTLAGAVQAGRFVYVIGGHDGTAATTSVLRAEILDPLQAPEILDLDADLGDGTRGLPGGLFIYRVAALLPLTDPRNPGGETLGGELFNVQLPSIDAGLVLTLTWERVPGAVGYRLYRSPTPDAPADSLELVAETQGDTSTTFVDDGIATDAAVRPLQAGSLGRFHAVASLATPREAHATVAVTNPDNDDEVFVYAVGGRSAADTALATGEVATITLSDGTLSAWRPLSTSLSVARAELQGLSITAADSPAAANKTLLFFTTGRRGNGQLSGVVEAAALTGTTGDLTPLTVESAPNPSRAGAAGLAANGFLYLFGGANGNDVSSELLDDTPTLDNWDALGGGSMNVARRFAAAAKDSAFLFIAGGHDGTAPITSVEQNIQ